MLSIDEQLIRAHIFALLLRVRICNYLNDAAFKELRAHLEHADRARAELFLKKTQKWLETAQMYNMMQRDFLPDLQTIAQVFAYAYASHGDDQKSVANHLITLRAAKGLWQVGSTDEKSKVKWWNNTHSLTALHSVLATFAHDAMRHSPNAYISTVDETAGRSPASESSPQVPGSARAIADATVLASGYPLYGYQLEALSTLQPPAVGRGIPQVDKVPATITANELYDKYISVGRPVVIKKGLLNNWGAQEQWKFEKLLQTRGDLSVVVARGPKPGINEWDKEDGDDEDFDGDASVNTQPDIIAGQVSAGQAENEEAVAQRRWDHFMKDIESKVAAGHVFDEKLMTITKPPELGGKTLSLMPPPKPGALKPGAQNNLGKPVKMSLTEYVTQIMAPKHGGEGKHVLTRNMSHPEDRYVFNTMHHGPLASDFVVPDLIEQLSTVGRHAGSFKDCHHPNGTFEFFIGTAGSGAYLHAHPAAWNGLVFGRKRWILLTPGKMQDNDDLPGGEVPAFEFFRDSYPIWKDKFADHLIEFYQEEGEVVYVPDNWGHAIMNLEPCVGVSKQIGTFWYPTGVPDSVTRLL